MFTTEDRYIALIISLVVLIIVGGLLLLGLGDTNQEQRAALEMLDHLEIEPWIVEPVPMGQAVFIATEEGLVIYYQGRLYREWAEWKEKLDQG